MSIIKLQQNTATALVFGPILAQSDGYTKLSGLTIHQSCVQIIRAGEIVLAEKGNTDSCTSAGLAGNYMCNIDAEDVSALGHMHVEVIGSAALPWWQDYWVQVDDPTISTQSAVSSALKTAITELSSEPGATPTFEEAVMFPYMALRNKAVVTTGVHQITNSAGTVVASATISDDGTSAIHNTFV